MNFQKKSKVKFEKKKEKKTDERLERKYAVKKHSLQTKMTVQLREPREKKANGTK